VVAELPSEIAAEILPPKIEKSATNGGPKPQELAPADLTEHERVVWSLLPADETVHIDSLLESSSLSFGDLNTALVGLDIRDLIRVLPGKHYARRI
jgi:predicted Rossmann fold nucleotide-binding protein DprA/Smf involved in DNA uptake